MKFTGRRRHAGWFMYKLQAYLNQSVPDSISRDTALGDYRQVAGVKKVLSRELVCLSHYHAGAAWSSKFSDCALFSRANNFFYNPLLPRWYNASIIKKFYFIKLLAARSKRATLLAKQKPVHGQRRWSNANTARRCNDFIHNIVLEYEIELFNFGHHKKMQWSKLYELRQKAKLRKKKPTKKWTKFRKFGEKRLSIKKKKKGPWD